MSKQLILFLEPNTAYDLAVELIEVNGVDIEIQEDQIKEPSTEKEHSLYAANFSELILLTVSFTNMAASLASFVALLLNYQTKQEYNSSTFIKSKQSIRIGGRIIPLSDFSTDQALINFIEEEFIDQEKQINCQERTIKLIAQRPIYIENKAESNSMSGNFNNDLKGANIANFANQLNDNARQQANQHNYALEQKQTLAEAAAEIQRLLKQLEEVNPTATEAEQKAFISAAVSRNQKQRFLNALQAGGKEALKEFLDNPYVNVAIAAIEGWKE
jgi:hypothetical protein